ncbi:MAG: 16S rRNA (guanine(527)-N(7))-methyltransferase RsmG [Pseudomonadota bacterium]
MARPIKRKGRDGPPGRREGRGPPRGPTPVRREGPLREFRPATEGDIGRLLDAYGFKLEARELSLLTRFHLFLFDKNRQLNLTRIHNLEDVVLKHYVDCFLVARMTELPSPLLDLGTGGGFPGIPLKIIRPDLHIILAEGVGKRVRFLKDVRAHLDLEGLDVIGRNIDREFFYPVNGVITRAVELIPDTLKRMQNSLQTGGLAIFMKGPNVDEEMTRAQRRYGDEYEVAFDLPYTLPRSTHRRRLLVYRRVRADIEDPETVLEETEGGS